MDEEHRQHPERFCGYCGCRLNDQGKCPVAPTSDVSYVPDAVDKRLEAADALDAMQDAGQENGNA